MKSNLPKKITHIVFLISCISILFSSKAFGQAPTVSSFSPTTITQRTSVVITGTNFTGATAVRFGGTNAASYTVVSPTQIRAIVNTGTTGVVSVVNSSGTGNSSATATYITPAGTASTAAVTRVISDFGGFWSSIATSSSAALQPNTRHNLTAFRYNGVVYSTNVDDTSLTTNGVAFTPAVFKALSSDGITGSTPTNAGNSNLIVLGSMVDGNATSGIFTSPAVAGLTVRDVLIDGINGLDLGTGVTNLNNNSVMAFDVSNITSSSLTDNTPDILITQIASPSSTVDIYSFVDSSGNVIGNPVGADLSAIAAVGTCRLDLFSLPVNTPYSTAVPSGTWGSNETRDIRLVAFKFSDFGINSSNASSIAKFKIMPGGDSDPAFIAYNAGSFGIEMPVITINPVSQFICVGASGPITFTVTATGSGLTYQWKKNNVNIPGATASTYTIASPTGVDIASYSVVVSNSSGSAIGTATLSAGGGTSEWNGTTWVGGVPGITSNIVFSGNYTSTGNLTGCNCIVNPSASVSILTNHTLRLQNELTVQSGGSFVLNNSASLVQVNDAAINTGAISMVRRTQPMKRLDYTYWSSPVSPQTLFNLSPATMADKYYRFDTAIDNWVSVPSATQMQKGVGYIVRAPQSFSTTVPSTYTATMSGIPNNGQISVPVSRGAAKSNLLGNPYPSGLNADLFLGDPANTSVIGGTIYLWTHSTVPNSSGQYADGDYAKWNLTGPVKATSPTSQLPTGVIASGQSFFVEGAVGTGSGNAIFKNNMRVGAGNSDFHRNPNADAGTIQKNRLWLNLENTDGVFNQVLVGYITNATDDLDRSFDGKVFGGSSTFLYSIVEDTQLAIQGRAIPFKDSDVVRLGYQTTAAGNLKIALEQFDGLFDNQNIYLRDNLLNIDHDLKATPYNFATQQGTFENRFEVVYQSEALGVKNPVLNANSIVIYKNNKNIVINSSLSEISEVRIFDIQGRLIYESQNINSNEKVISNLFAAEQVLIVQVQNAEGAKVSKKLIF